MKTCPHCGQTLSELPPAFGGLRLTPSQDIILQSLVRAGKNGLPRDAIIDKLYADHPDGGPVTATRVVWVLMCQLRKKLALIGKTIVTEHGGRGAPGLYSLRDL